MIYKIIIHFLSIKINQYPILLKVQLRRINESIKKEIEHLVITILKMTKSTLNLCY